MKNAPHSPGPWKITDKGEAAPHTSYVSDRDGHKVCTVESYPYQSTGKADARLISATTELLDAARIGLAAVIAWGGKCEAAGEKILAAESVTKAEVIRAAIAKATEEKP